ncbi:FecR family protein [Pedobacter sp. L105]|uniref:FecR family protein n=1 Tax=Pedobacter sp. L105 TaxID=1641871 RepID=UPI00131B990C|nr:FecR domain-containing protein [Pedobacter sp. L105]
MNNRIKILFERYQTGKATPEERELVEVWFESHYGQQGRKLSRNQETEVFEDLDTRIAAILTESSPVRKPNLRWLQVAAVFVTLMGAGLYSYHQFVQQTQVPETYTEFRSRNGEKKQFTLPDGTTIFLNSGSSVYVSSRFGQQRREVKLSGEAFFDVHHNAALPFIIHSGKLQTTDIGTSFNINAYPDENKVQITVASGSVKVETNSLSGKSELYTKRLTINQSLVYNKLKDSHVVTIVNSDSISSWRTNHLNFDNATYIEISRSIARWYNLDITLSPKIHDSKKYTLSFINERPDKVLNVLSNLTHTTYMMKGRTVMINPMKSEKM